MSPCLSEEDTINVNDFLNKMESDMKEANDMCRTEDNLIKAVQEYEKAWKVKLKIIHEPT